MGMSRLDELTAGLIAAGKDAATPAAVAQSAWTAEQRSVRAPLSSLAAASRESRLRHPAVIVIGDVAAVLPEQAAQQAARPGARPGTSRVADASTGAPAGSRRAHDLPLAQAGVRVL